MWPLLVILGLVAATSEERPRKISPRRWEELGDSAVELEHHWGRVYFEINNGTYASLLSATRKLSLAVNRAPQHEHDTSKESFAKFREKYLGPAMYMLEQAIQTLADMKARGVKSVKALRESRINKLAAGLASTQDRFSIRGETS